MVLPIGPITLPLRLEWTSLSTLKPITVDRPPTHLLTFFGSLEVTQFVHDPGCFHMVDNTGQLLPIEGVFRLQKLHLVMDARAGVRIVLVALRVGLKTPFIEVEEGGADDMVIAI